MMKSLLKGIKVLTNLKTSAQRATSLVTWMLCTSWKNRTTLVVDFCCFFFLLAEVKEINLYDIPIGGVVNRTTLYQNMDLIGIQNHILRLSPL